MMRKSSQWINQWAINLVSEELGRFLTVFDPKRSLDDTARADDGTACNTRETHHVELVVTDCSTRPREVALLDEVIDQLDTRSDGCSSPDCRAPEPAPALQLVDTRPGPDRELV